MVIARLDGTKDNDDRDNKTDGNKDDEIDDLREINDERKIKATKWLRGKALFIGEAFKLVED